MTNRAQRIRARRARVARIDQKIDKVVKSATYRLSWHHYFNARLFLTGSDYIGCHYWGLSDEGVAKSEELIASGEFPVTDFHRDIPYMSINRIQIVDASIRRAPFYRFALENGFDLAIEYSANRGEFPSNLTFRPYLVIDRKARFKTKPDFYYVHDGEKLEPSLRLPDPRKDS